MSIIHVQQIKAAVIGLFGDYMDISDRIHSSAHDREATQVSRCLSAFVPYYFASASVEESATSVIDGPNDNGIDSIYFDKQEKILYVTQAKWESDGNGSIAKGDGLNLISGFRDLINMRFDRFNQKFLRMKDQIQSCMLDANTKFCIIFITTGQQQISEHSRRDFDDLLEEMNDPTGVVTFRYVSQGEFHSLISQDAKGNPINVDVVLYEWGKVRDPFPAYYGQIAASEVAQWYGAHHSHLFTPNLRVFLGSTDANTAIIRTVTESPERLWYFNNGITAICDEIKKKLLGGDSRDSGIFECLNLRVVNGAQTIGSIYTASTHDALAMAKSRLPIRIVSLEGCPPDFSLYITRATNTQNKIELRDFATLDDNQRRIAQESYLDGISYVYKSGEIVPNAESAFDFVEATVALACSRDTGLAVQAKREISRLWDDVTKSPYKTLYNPSLTGRKLWRLVQLQRAIDACLRDATSGLAGREAMIPVHGNRLIAHIMFSKLDLSPLQNAECDLKPLIETIEGDTVKVIQHTMETVNRLYPDSYLASLFKNRAKCEKIFEGVTKLLV